MSDVFVSYSRRDSEFVGRLAASVSERGKEVWLDTEGIACEILHYSIQFVTTPFFSHVNRACSAELQLAGARASSKPIRAYVIASNSAQ